MRDPKRIRKILKELGDVWETCPDLRLGQLITNCCDDTKEVTNDVELVTTLFYIEDEVLIDRIKIIYKKLDIKNEQL
jgi:hypothetical protein